MQPSRFRIAPLLIGLFLALFLAACGAAATQPTATSEETSQLKVIATTNIVGDVVRAVGGDAIHLSVLLPPGAEPHGFQPSPQDVASLTEADLVFVNGLELEESLLPVLENAVAAEKIISVSDGIEVIALDEEEHEHEDESAEEDHHHGVDPHTWTDPNNVMIWVDNIANGLAAADPARAETYRSQGEAYKQELTDIDAWIRTQVAQIPEANRKLVTDHAVFGYFANRYGFEQVGAVIPGYSALAEPSAQELAQLEDAIRALGVKALFVGNTVKPGLTERVANDVGVALAQIYTDSLSDSDGPAPTYLDWVRYNVAAFVEGLK